MQKNDVSAALQFVATAKAELTAQHQKATELKSGMDIFNIPQPTYKELAQNEKVPCLDPPWRMPHTCPACKPAQTLK